VARRDFFSVRRAVTGEVGLAQSAAIEGIDHPRSLCPSRRRRLKASGEEARVNWNDDECVVMG
jgi:hypothetical protein